jgi:hypothetical protein
MTGTDHQETAGRPPTVTAVVTADPFPTWAVITYGVLTALIGVALLVWPKATVKVVVVLFAIQLIVSGVIQLVRCVSPWAHGAGERTLLALSGALALLIALLLLRRPLQTLVVVTMVVGAWWIIRGVMDIVGAIPSGVPHRGWSVALGGISLVAGIFVLLNPEISLVTFVWIGGLWMMAFGILIAIAAFMLRSKNRTAR